MSEVFVNSNLFNGGVLATEDGGFAREYINGTGSASVKGSTVHIAGANTVDLTQQDDPDCIGVVYNSGIPDGGKMWVVTEGTAKVYFIGNTTAGHLARTFVAADGDYVEGQAKSEAVPTSPFANDKHFCEIGHVAESRTGAGLALVKLHFN